MSQMNVRLRKQTKFGHCVKGDGAHSGTVERVEAATETPQYKQNTTTEGQGY